MLLRVFYLLWLLGFLDNSKSSPLKWHLFNRQLLPHICSLISCPVSFQRVIAVSRARWDLFVLVPNYVCILCLLTIIVNDNENKCSASKKQTKHSKWEKETSLIIFWNKCRAIRVMGGENSILPPWKWTYSFFIIMIICSQMIVHIMRLFYPFFKHQFYYWAHIAAVSQCFLPFVC